MFTDFEMLTSTLTGFGISFQRFQPAWDFDILIVAGGMRFFFDPETESLLEVSK